MKTSRRSFLRGAAALPTIAVTGGGSVAAAGSAGAILNGGALAAALSAAERKARAMTSLARHGGFPYGSIYHILNRERVGAESIESIGERVFNGGAYRRSKNVANETAKNSNKRLGPIDFDRDATFLRNLKSFPQDVPLLDIISTDVLSETRETSEDSHPYNRFFSRMYGRPADFASAEDVADLRDFLSKHCEEHTTAADLSLKMHGYFLKLSRHFIDHPTEFAKDYRKGSYVAEDLGRLVKSSAGELSEGAQGILAELDQRKNKYSEASARLYKIRNDRGLEAQRKAREAQQTLAEKERIEREERHRVRMAEQSEANKKAEFKRQEELQKKRTQPDARERFEVFLMDSDGGDYMATLANNAGMARLTLLDWFQLAQEIDPHSAKPKDVELRCGGKMVAFHNPKVDRAIKALMKNTHKGDWFKVTLPNRRMGVDLNERPEISGP